ncbi:MAG: hypothetical protein RL434_393 [Pseudomonadota bacterium]|jgi:hypothetical protein
MDFTPDEIRRFDAKTVVRDDGCVEWTAALRSNGYGQFHMRRIGANMLPHRFAWIRQHGPIPEGMLVCHKCDNRKCVNPDHLFLGTPADNSADMVAKGRGKGFSMPGVKHPRHKLSPVEVEAIRLSGSSYRELSAAFGVSKSQIHRIKAGAQWNTSTLQALTA